MRKRFIVLLPALLLWAECGFSYSAWGEPYWLEFSCADVPLAELNCFSPNLPQIPATPPAPAPVPAPVPAPAPVLPSPGSSISPTGRLWTSAPAVVSGGTAYIAWSSTDADRCEASGSWSGTLPASGKKQIGPLTKPSTFTLSCSGPGGSVVSIVSVDVRGRVALAWRPPTRKEDGSPANDLAGYRIYYGSKSGKYDGVKQISDAQATGRVLELPIGAYYFALTAFDASGNESGYSNEITKSAM